MRDKKPVRAISAQEEKIAKKVIRFYTWLNVIVYRLTRGRLMGRFPGGGPVCLVTFTGRKTGKKRTIGLIHTLDEHGNLILIASQGGMSKHPVWYFNLKANPDIEVNYRGQVRRLRAEQIEDAEKQRLWPIIVANHEGFDEYQERTTRNIPVFVCKPVA